jgi:spore coat polysaccharide biosynthesis protein SpsF
VIVGAVVRARMASNRLPGKTLLEAAGKTMLEHTVERLARSRLLGPIVVATTALTEDDDVAGVCHAIGVPCFRGSPDDVLDRVYSCAKHHALEHVAHFGADNPLIDASVCDEILEVYVDGSWDYVTNNLPPTYPDGQEVEVTSFSALERTWSEAQEQRHREHVLTYIWEHPDRFRIRNVERRPPLADERWTLDYPEDYELLRAVFEALHPANPAFGIDDVLAFLDAHPELRALNSAHRRPYARLHSGAA